MAHSSKRKTYLSRVQSGYDRRQWYRRPTKLLGNVVFSTGHVRNWKISRCLITDLSEGGASIRVGKANIPDEFYIVLGNKELVIGCLVVERRGDQLHLCFVRQIETKLVNQLARLDTPYATLGTLFGENGCLKRYRPPAQSRVA